MAHFAELDDSNIVKQVIVVSDDNEADGENWCKNLLGGNWKQTSYNGNIRKNYAGIGFTYDETKDAFIPPQPYPSWSLNSVYDWEPPIPEPNDDCYYWDEDAYQNADTTGWCLPNFQPVNGEEGGEELIE